MKRLFTLVLLTIFFCIGYSSCNQPENSAKTQDSSEKEVAKTQDPSEKEVAELFNSVCRIEDFIRVPAENVAEVDEVEGKGNGDGPHFMLAAEINTLEKLTAYCKEVYSKKAMKQYFEELLVSEMYKNKKEIGIPIYRLYEKIHDFKKTSTVILIEDNDSLKTYKIIAPTVYNTIDTITNFVICKEAGKWKVNVSFDKMIYH